MGGLHYFGQLNGGITAHYEQKYIKRKPNWGIVIFLSTKRG